MQVSPELARELSDFVTHFCGCITIESKETPKLSDFGWYIDMSIIYNDGESEVVRVVYRMPMGGRPAQVSVKDNTGTKCKLLTPEILQELGYDLHMQLLEM